MTGTYVVHNTYIVGVGHIRVVDELQLSEKLLNFFDSLGVPTYRLCIG